MIERIKNGEILISDGAIGTILMQGYINIGEPPEIINLRDPTVLENISKSYLEAGAELIQTNTFGASRMRLTKYSLEGKLKEINRAAIRAVKNVVAKDTIVVASVGPTGRLLKPYGDVDVQEIKDNYKEQMEIIYEEGVDAVCIETMTDINEMRLAIEAAKSLSDEIPIIATMTFDETPRGFYTVMGYGVREAIKVIEESGANVVGSNCGNGIDKMVKIAIELRKYAVLPIIIQSNAGLPILKDGNIYYPESPEYMASKSIELVRAGVSIVGGCCGTTPAHIKAIRQAVKPNK
jgi:5-methyltetrahydrofolate--homocysteine methyltransferase